MLQTNNNTTKMTSVIRATLTLPTEAVTAFTDNWEIFLKPQQFQMELLCLIRQTNHYLKLLNRRAIRNC
jgi:hypothetical protein